MTRTLKLVSAGVGVAAMLGIMGASSFANFTANTSDPGNNTFVAGTVSIKATSGKFSEIEESGAKANVGSFDAQGNMSPGDTYQKTLTVTNNGSLPELYQLSVSSTGELFQHMQFKNNGVLSNYYPATVSITAPTDSSGDQATLVQGVNDQNPVTTSQWIEIDPGASETLTVSVHLPFSANNAYQGTTGSFTIDLNAQQADNYQNKHNSNPPGSVGTLYQTNSSND